METQPPEKQRAERRKCMCWDNAPNSFLWSDKHWRCISVIPLDLQRTDKLRTQDSGPTAQDHQHRPASTRAPTTQTSCERLLFTKAAELYPHIRQNKGPRRDFRNSYQKVARRPISAYENGAGFALPSREPQLSMPGAHWITPVSQHPVWIYLLAVTAAHLH